MDGPDFPVAMREAFRSLRPGGFIAFSILRPCFITLGIVEPIVSSFFLRRTLSRNEGSSAEAIQPRTV
ncbi:hypothetical protein O3W52_27745 [Ensifer psoraleae]|uniref:Methyltransferase type 11 domain-containing protein n=2 Tax=Sinorhizobium psoraleae TaxID=520838 RepID=A0ABT4KP50_9HYPH|nr:hypothetical protein [Sinorhizobium psoraleae]